jgi:acyl-CoA thioester hydrolase
MNAVPQPAIPPIDLSDPAVFGHLTSETLRFGDVDANGHINNVAYLVLFENARVTYIMQHLPFMRERRLSTVIARLDIDFRRQMHYPGTVRAGARLVEVRRSSFVLGQAIFDAEGNCTASGHAVVVAFDPATGRGQPIADQVRRDLLRIAGSPTGVS